MSVTTESILAFFDALETLEADKKAITNEIKDNIEAFAGNHEINKKSVKKAYKEWQEWKKDNSEFTEIDLEADALLVAAVPEFTTEVKNAGN